MTEDEYLDALSARMPKGTQADTDTLSLAEEALAAYPQSTRLWCMRGDLIQLGSADIPYTLDDARASYERALAIDPANAEALQELGHFFYAIDPQPGRAEEYFQRALARGATVHAYLRLADLYVETGRAREALQVLSPGRCPYQDHEEVILLRAEIAGTT